MRAGFGWVALVALACGSASSGCGRLGFGSAQLTPGDGGTDGASSLPATSVGYVCRFTMATVILDGDTVDGRVGADMAAAVASGCGTGLTTRMVSESDPSVLDPVTHAPLLAPTDLGIIGGDSYYQDVMLYLGASLTPLRTLDASGRYAITRRSTGAVIVDVDISTITPTHDYAVIQIISDPASGGTFIATHGYYFAGTLAGSHYFARQIAPNLPTETRGFFVLEWTNADADPEPSTGDTYTVLATGP